LASRGWSFEEFVQRPVYPSVFYAAAQEEGKAELRRFGRADALELAARRAQIPGTRDCTQNAWGLPVHSAADPASRSEATQRSAFSGEG
jgi:hypothetical protein